MTMTPELEEELAAALELETCQRGGFLYDYRDGKFNEDAYLRVRKLIAAIDFSGQERISKRIVARIYDIPARILMGRDHVVGRGGSAMLCDLAFGEITHMLIRKFAPNSTEGDAVDLGDKIG